ncbi:MAG: asparagine synthase (glutamine-hydrolyzing) [Burkholderiales bacterium]
MCGLTGVLQHRADEGLASSVAAMTQALLHRGPDDGDTWVDGPQGVAIGHRRLAIIDLSAAGHQPMHSACGRYVIAFNGEIYNHLALRDELAAAGHAPAWRGTSDTETLLACIAAWGLRATLDRLSGMFAIALWDRSERRLHLARDRFGEKPLYYGWARGAFVFGSELKSLRRYPGFDNPVDRDVLALYMQFCQVPAPYAIYRDTYKLEAGCMLSLGLADAAAPPSRAPFAPMRHGGMALERYWSLADVAQRGLAEPLRDERVAVDQLEAVLGDAVQAQMIADVPLGAFLSGGVDSSTVVALMQARSTSRVKTFTVGFDEAGFDESDYARAVAVHLHTEHTEVHLPSDAARELIPQLPQIYCEPFADSSQIPTYLVSKVARQQVTVALSGDGGDELFGGYNRYLWGQRIWDRVGWLPQPLRRLLGAMIRTLPVPAWNRLGAALPRRHGVALLGDKAHRLADRLSSVDGVDALYRSLLTEWPARSGVVPGSVGLPLLLDEAEAGMSGSIADAEHRMMFLDALTYLPDDILHKVDRAAMAVSLETRVPLLDRRVAELAWRMPLQMKVRDGQTKWALRQVLYRHVPRQLIERPKAGFGVPLGRWLRGPLREWAEALLDPRRMAQEGFLDADMVQQKWREHAAGTRDWTPSLWNVLMFQAWLAGER